MPPGKRAAGDRAAALTMPRCVAFLRAINVGGHTVKMDRLRALFETLGFDEVETFIASGNVLFDTRAGVLAVERKIEAALQKALGYEVRTFVRTADEIVRIAKYLPFPQQRIDTAVTFNLGFTAAPLDAAAKKKLAALATDADELRAHDRTIFWLSRTRMSESPLFKISFEKVLGCPITFRNANTIRRLADKFR
jgi:uncharacterized protein (DUF1697 family)